MIEDGIARGSFALLIPIDLRQMILLATERERAAAFPDRCALNPVDRIRASRIGRILRLLTPAAAP